MAKVPIPSNDQIIEMVEHYHSQWKSLPQIYKAFVKKWWLEAEEWGEDKFVKWFEQRLWIKWNETPEQEEQPTPEVWPSPEAWPEWETINWVEDFDMDSATDDVAKDFIYYRC